MAHRFPRAVIFALCLLLLLPAVASGQAPELQAFNSRSYQIKTNLTRDEVIRYAERMDQVFAHYSQKFSGLRSRRQVQMPLFLLRTQEDYIAFMAERGIDATHSGGMFFVTGGVSGLATWTAGRSRTQAYQVLQHEGFHQFAWNYIGHEMPVWMNEGLAQYFEDAILVGQAMKLGIGDARRIAAVKQALQTDRAIPFETLLSVTHAEWADTLRSDPERAARMYAQAWSLVYFLVHADGGKYQGALSRYLELVSSGRTSDKAFREAFGLTDLSPAEQRWRQFALAQEPDPVSAAGSSLAFLGQAIRYLEVAEGATPIPMPKTLEELKQVLQAHRFTLTRQSHGMTTELKAEDESLYRFVRANGNEGEFELLEPTADDLPPRITARGLRPEPTLVWTRDAQGQLVHEIEYR